MPQDPKYSAKLIDIILREAVPTGDPNWGKRQGAKSKRLKEEALSNIPSKKRDIARGKVRFPGEPRVVGKEARVHKIGRGQIGQFQPSTVMRRANTLKKLVFKGRGAVNAVIKGEGAYLTAKQGLKRETRNRVANVYAKGPNPGFSKLSKVAKRFGKSALILSVLEGMRNK